MIRVMIVDDEPIIRAGLSSVIKWDTMGCEVVAAAENGEEALKLLDTVKPEIIISDIKMPKKDGLELMHELHERKYNCKSILVTGYKEFELAQRAVKYGVREYVLKPVDHEQLTEIVRKLTEEIHTEAKILREHDQLREKVRRSLPLLRDKFLHDLLFRKGTNQLYGIQDRLDYFGIQLNHFTLAVIGVDSYYSITKNWSEDDKLILSYLIVDQLQTLADEDEKDIVICINDDRIFAFMCGIIQKKQQVIDFYTRLSQRVYEQGHFNISVGISNACDAPEQAYYARFEAERCLARCGLLGGSCISCESDLEKSNLKLQVCLDMDGWINALKNGTNMEVEFQKLMDAVRSMDNTVASRMTVAEVLISSVRAYSVQYGDENSLNERFVEAMKDLYTAYTLRDYWEILEKNGQFLQEQVKRHMISRNGKIMEQAKRYMEENSDREVTLDEVADHVFLSKWYFSKLFKKELGKNFNDYMTVLRIERAKRMLREQPTLRNYEVAEKMGFSNVRYFSKLFKSIAGVTPSEYRGLI